MKWAVGRMLAAAAVGLITLTAAGAALVGPAGAATPGPPSHPEYWFNTWNVPALWADGYQGQGVTIAEIDTGVNAGLPELAGSILSGTDLGAGGNGQIDRDESGFGHGTAMASIMVGQPGSLGVTGLAPKAKILPIAVPLSDTTDANGSDDHLAEAIRWAADNGGKVISMSLGGNTSPTEPCPTDEQSAIYYALSKGDVLLAASGNNGQMGNDIEEPGVCLGVISVGAVDQTNTVASFSSRHPYLTLTAPGVDIPSLGRVAGTVYAGNGTSEATAIASAVIALEWSKYQSLTGEQIVTRLLSTLDKHTGQHDDAYGYGIVNAGRALTAAVPADAANPVYTAVQPFLARYEALAAPATAPPITSPPAQSGQFGQFVAGTPGTGLAPGLVRWLVVAGIALLALLGLSGAGLVRHRRFTVVPADVPEPAATMTAPLTPSPVSAPDAAGLQWHDIIVPPEDDPPAAMRP